MTRYQWPEELPCFRGRKILLGGGYGSLSQATGMHACLVERLFILPKTLGLRFEK